MTRHILVVDDEANARTVLTALLEQAGYAVSAAASAEACLASIRELDPDLVLTDLRMPGADGMELLGRLRRDFPEIPVVLLTAHGTIENAVEAMKRGAHDFLTKPFDRDRVLQVLSAALAQGQRSRDEFQGPFGESLPCGMVGASVPMRTLFRMIERVAPSPATVLVTGETGTGKELVAEALHRLSPRHAGPLIRINCGALPESLVESELFGHERGAFTGADRTRVGRFELAHGGTLFLDEIGELSAAAQVKLLRALETGTIDRLGGGTPRTVDVRLVAATHVDLAAAVAAGAFRADLLYRLRVVEIRVPPLRERLDDLPALVRFFVEKHATRLQRPRVPLAPDTLSALAGRAWPGNVRELENAVERALLLGDGQALRPEDFEPGVPASGAAPAEPGLDIRSASRASAAETERRLVRAALEATGGNVTRAAERLGLSRRGLQLKMKGLGLRSS